MTNTKTKKTTKVDSPSVEEINGIKIYGLTELEEKTSAVRNLEDELNRLYAEREDLEDNLSDVKADLKAGRGSSEDLIQAEAKLKALDFRVDGLAGAKRPSGNRTGGELAKAKKFIEGHELDKAKAIARVLHEAFGDRIPVEIHVGTGERFTPDPNTSVPKVIIWTQPRANNEMNLSYIRTPLLATMPLEPVKSVARNYGLRLGKSSGGSLISQPDLDVLIDKPDIHADVLSDEIVIDRMIWTGRAPIFHSELNPTIDEAALAQWVKNLLYSEVLAAGAGPISTDRYTKTSGKPTVKHRREGDRISLRATWNVPYESLDKNREPDIARRLKTLPYEAPRYVPCAQGYAVHMQATRNFQPGGVPMDVYPVAFSCVIVADPAKYGQDAEAA